MDNFRGREASRRPFHSTSGGLRRSGSKRAQSRRVGWLVSRETERSMIPGCAGHPSRFSLEEARARLGAALFSVSRETGYGIPQGAGRRHEHARPIAVRTELIHSNEEALPSPLRDPFRTWVPAGVYPAMGCGGRSHRRSSRDGTTGHRCRVPVATSRTRLGLRAAGPHGRRQSARRSAASGLALPQTTTSTTNSSHRCRLTPEAPRPGRAARSDPLGPSQRSVGTAPHLRRVETSFRSRCPMPAQARVRRAGCAA